jgi:hypothetical protein
MWPLCCLSFFDLQILITPLVSFGHCVVCHSLIYRFWLLLWYLVAIVLSVILWFTDSDYSFGILWPLCCLSFFDLQILITPLVSLIYIFWLLLWYLQILLVIIWLILKATIQTPNYSRKPIRNKTLTTEIKTWQHFFLARYISTMHGQIKLHEAKKLSSRNQTGLQIHWLIYQQMNSISTIFITKTC